MAQTQYHGPWIALGSRNPATRILAPRSLSIVSSTISESWSGINGNIAASVNSGINAGSTGSGTLYVETTNDPRAADQNTASLAAWVPVVSIVASAGLLPNGSTATILPIPTPALYCRVRWVGDGSGTGYAGYVFITGVNG